MPTPSIHSRQANINENLRNSHLHPLLQRLYANRGVQSLREVDYRLENLQDFSRLKDIDKAADIVAGHIRRGSRILIVGDFDADGATSCALMIRSLNAFGHNHVDYLVPNRFDYGYGLSPQIVEVAAESSPALIITVDNGIASVQGVQRANELGIEVLITDHHLPGDELPAAAAIVNPNQPGCDFAAKHTAGVGVAFYLMLAVRARLRELNWFEGKRAQPNMACVLDLVALGTVADVVPLDQNNRILVHAGLQRVKQQRACAGILALLHAAGRDPAQCSASDFGFLVGPRLNAAGRLDDISLGIECLLCDDPAQAAAYAAELDQMNRQRRQIEGDMLEQALSQMQQISGALVQQPLPDALALFDRQWHQGVVGLLASRLKEKYHRPVIAFADAGSGELKGSGRSIPGLHMRDVLDLVDKRHPGLILKFGGHAMAAGLSLRADRFEAFQQAFVEQVSVVLPPDALENRCETDGSIEAEDLNLATAEILQDAGPWGQQFPEPLFDDEFEILDWRLLKDKHLKLQLRHPGSSTSIEAIAFNTTDADLPDDGSGRVRLVYALEVNEFRGRRVQLRVKALLGSALTQ